MSSTTQLGDATGTVSRVRLSGLACVVGGALWLLLNLSEAVGISLGSPVVKGVVGTTLLLCLMGGPLGLLGLRAAEGGRVGRIGRGGAVVAVLGLLSDLVGQAAEYFFGFAAGEIGVFYAAGALLVGLGMLTSGVAVLLARRLAGWRRFAPLSVGLYYPAMIPVQILFFILPNGVPSNTLLAFWGLTWMLLGYAICTTQPGSRSRNPQTA